MTSQPTEWQNADQQYNVDWTGHTLKTQFANLVYLTISGT